MKKFSFKEFIQLDITSLLSVNGGSCSSTSPSSNSGGSNSSSSNSSGSSGNNGSGGGGSTSSSSRSKGGISVCVNTGYGTSTTRTYDKNGNESSKSTTKVNGSGGSGSSGSYSSSGSSASSGGGSCSSSSSGKVYTNTYYKSSTSSSSASVSGQGSGVTGSNGGTLCGGGHTEDVSGGSCSSGGKVNKSEEPAIMEPLLTAAEKDALEVKSNPFVCAYSEEEINSINNIEEIYSEKNKAGQFGQITDGSYADYLTMQFYKDYGTVDGEVTDAYMNNEKDSSGKVSCKNSFSKYGCLMTAAAKVLSEVSGEEISLLDINSKVDKNNDGLLSCYEIGVGMQEILGDKFDVKYDYWEKTLSAEKFEEVSKMENTYVLARAYGDCDGNGTNEHHWVVLEGYQSDTNGKLVFSYDGTSDNDLGRQYVYGEKPDSKNKIFTVDKIETYTFIKK